MLSLEQSLRSNDSETTEWVLQHTEVGVITNTVKELKKESVTDLLDTLINLNTNVQPKKCYLLWLSALMKFRW